MRILAYVHAYVPFHGAGAETTMHDLLKHLVKQGHECTVLISRDSGNGVRDIHEEYTVDGVRVIPFNGQGEQAGQWMIDPDLDAIITHLDATERVCAMQHLHKKPIVQLIHNTMFQTTGYLALGAQLVVHNTQWVKEHHEAQLQHIVVPIVTVGSINWMTRRASSWNTVVVHPPVHPEEYVVTDGPRDCVTLINLWPGGTYGETHTGKGPEIFWALAARFPEQRFLAVKGGYGEQMVRDLPNVEVIENTPDVASIYRRTKVLLMPSRYESFGRVAIEAAASGIPTIAHPTPGLQEALGEGGTYANRNNIDEYASKLHLLLNDPDAYAIASQYALERSLYWDKALPAELETFSAAIEEVARKGL